MEGISGCTQRDLVMMSWHIRWGRPCFRRSKCWQHRFPGKLFGNPRVSLGKGGFQIDLSHSPSSCGAHYLNVLPKLFWVVFLHCTGPNLKHVWNLSQELWRNPHECGTRHLAVVACSLVTILLGVDLDPLALGGVTFLNVFLEPPGSCPSVIPYWSG